MRSSPWGHPARHCVLDYWTNLEQPMEHSHGQHRHKPVGV